MARGNVKMRFRFVVANAVAGPTDGTDIYDENTDYSKDMSLNTAISRCLSFIRRFQSGGIDVEGKVYGIPYGDPSDNPVRAFQGTEADEKIYAHLDTVALGLKQRIRLANQDAAELAAGGSLDADVDPDL